MLLPLLVVFVCNLQVFDSHILAEIINMLAIARKNGFGAIHQCHFTFRRLRGTRLAIRSSSSFLGTFTSFLASSSNSLNPLGFFT